MKYNIVNLLFIFCFIQFLIGQSLKSIGLDNKDKVVRLVESFMLESEIDPDIYVLGPGDKIGLSINTTSNVSYVITITPAGSLWIPDLGQVYISGMNINTAEHKVKKYIQENLYKTADINLVLLNIRQFKNQVIGAVVNPGLIAVTSIDRLSDIIRKSGGLHKLADEDNISITNNKGSKNKYSLRRFQIDGNLTNNPVLNNGDVVYVPYKEEYKDDIHSTISYKQSLIFVTGFVVRPSGHKYKAGYTVNDYISMSGGVNDFGSYNNLTVNRNGNLISSKNIYNLEPGDQINVPANMKYRLLGNMSALQTITAMMTLYLTYQAATN